ncbi:universal stress protein [Spirilliplanes yamanashiensis]|uniref:UspA domain-containing protein n=1 Tax=Spirilliplanes yamanashiensis TaxID=42233 RepID=A0A8J3YFE4_9ACTN|nr:universal stress protein [Spirilliplanes yamanashiensis]MDP9818250.1 nucleotide-binding universal stress UspA family protein [Spirilliplanes yamanashiensis]GIJ06668.1 hypothetical protein Sya03_60200 [Spirilliplanes yamanashiensis]
MVTPAIDRGTRHPVTRSAAPHPTAPNATAAAVLRALRNRGDRRLAAYLAVDGDPDDALTGRPRQGGLIVVGAHLPPGADGGADHETCPVLVYGPGRPDGPGTGPVLLALDDDANAAALTWYASAEAARRGSVLRVVHVWAETGSPQGRRLGRHDRISDADRLLAGVLHESGRPAGPPPERQIVHDRLPAHALDELSRTAALLVVGARSRSADRHGDLGETAGALLGRTRCPLAILPARDDPG